MANELIGLYEEIILRTMTSNSLTENEEHDIHAQILKSFFGLHASVIFRPLYVWFLAHLQSLVIPNFSGQLAKLIVYIIPPE